MPRRTTTIAASPVSIPTSSPIIAKLRAWVDADGRSKTELAKAAGMTRQQFGKILEGQSPNMQIGTVEKLLDVLGKTLVLPARHGRGTGG